MSRGNEQTQDSQLTVSNYYTGRAYNLAPLPGRANLDSPRHVFGNFRR